MDSKPPKAAPGSPRITSNNNNNNNLPAKKFSHPVAYTVISPEAHQLEAYSPPNTPRLAARGRNNKKHSLPTCAMLPVPFINKPYEEEGGDNPPLAAFKKRYIYTKVLLF